MSDEEEKTPVTCRNPPAGWTCSRDAGHPGPCAASPVLAVPDWTISVPPVAVVDHFPVSEFTCHDGTPYPTVWVATRLAKLKRALEKVRARWGTLVEDPRLIVVCGYRTPAYNEHLHHADPDGVAQDSQHPEGNAADVRPLRVADVPRFYMLVVGMISTGALDEVGGYGPYPGWVHLDVRDKPPDGHVAHWLGKGYGSDR